MESLTEELARISKNPGKGSERFKAWISQDDFVRFLQKLTHSNEVILYASMPSVFMYSALVPTAHVTPPDAEDLDQWGCNPFSSWGISIRFGESSRATLSHPLEGAGAKTLADGEQIVFARSFDGRHEEPFYIEISQRLAHVFGLHYVPERGAYSRFDERGDIEDVVKVSRLSAQSNREEGLVVTILRSVLDEYMVITDQALVGLFDSPRVDAASFGGWSKDRVYHRLDPEIFYRIGHGSEDASYLRGFRIIRPGMSNKDVVERQGFGESKRRQYATFIAQDWKRGQVRECSCDPKQLGNYFVQSDLPYETAPVFFRPDVLQKYKADSRKYQVQHRSISCRHAWSLQTYDVNEAGQVHTYLIYLSYLPYDEQLYWKSFNEPPKSPISRRAFQSDFEGVWDQGYDPLQSLEQFLRELHAAQVSWWRLRDESLFDVVHYPVTNSADEWARELHALDKLLIEGFETKELRTRLTKLGGPIDPKWRSLKLMEEILRGFDFGEDQVREIVEPFRELNTLRNKMSGHPSGKEAAQIKARVLRQHKTFPVHFRWLCTECDKAVRALFGILEPGKSSEGSSTSGG